MRCNLGIVREVEVQNDVVMVFNELPADDCAAGTIAHRREWSD